MRWMFDCDCDEWDQMVLTLDYQLSFPTSMYEQRYIDSIIDPQPNELVEIPRIHYWLTGKGTILPFILCIG